MTVSINRLAQHLFNFLFQLHVTNPTRFILIHKLHVELEETHTRGQNKLNSRA